MQRYGFSWDLQIICDIFFQKVFNRYNNKLIFNYKKQAYRVSPNVCPEIQWRLDLQDYIRHLITRFESVNAHNRTLSMKNIWAFSSAGSEHLPYKKAMQRYGFSWDLQIICDIFFQKVFNRYNNKLIFNYIHIIQWTIWNAVTPKSMLIR